MPNLKEPLNQNYAATIVKVSSLVPLANCDNIQGMPIFGMQAIVGMDTKVGDYGVLFPTEVQLSPKYISYNNLYRQAEDNADQTKKGYLENNGRVKSLTLRSHRSDALFMPLSSLDYLNWDSFKEGDTFDEVSGTKVCWKYEKPTAGQNPMRTNTTKLDKRVDTRFIPEQFDITHWQRSSENIAANTAVVITQKLHGTNIRIANTFVTYKPNWRERIARRFGVKVVKQELAEVFGSHHVIKDANNPNHRHFYDFDLWSREGQKLTGLVPQGYILYGELIGWAGEKPIQPGYTYNVPKGKTDLYIYRASVCNPQGRTVDLSWKAVKELCAEIGVKHVPELVNTYASFVENPILKQLTDKKLYELDGGWEQLFGDKPVPLSEDSPCDEGVCVRIEGLTPKIYKIKFPMFLAHETKTLDNPEVQEVQEDATEGTPVVEAGEVRSGGRIEAPLPYTDSATPDTIDWSERGGVANIKAVSPVAAGDFADCTGNAH